MPYRIAGIDVHKKMLAVVVADVEVDGDFHFDAPEGRDDARRPARAGRVADRARRRGSRHGVDRAGTGGRCGKRWNSIGAPDAVRALVRHGSRARSISPKRNRIADPGAARGTSRMRSGW